MAKRTRRHHSLWVSTLINIKFNTNMCYWAAGGDRLDHRRLSVFVILPGLAPYDAAKANGTIAWPSVNRIRMYDLVDIIARIQIPQPALYPTYL